MPISAMTNTRSPSPTQRPPIRTLFFFMIASPGGESAVDDEVRSGHVTGCFAGQKNERAAVLVGPRHAAERRLVAIASDEERILSVLHASGAKRVDSHA